jgi:hypothetical protein
MTDTHGPPLDPANIARLREGARQLAGAAPAPREFAVEALVDTLPGLPPGEANALHARMVAELGPAEATARWNAADAMLADEPGVAGLILVRPADTPPVQVPAAAGPRCGVMRPLDRWPHVGRCPNAATGERVVNGEEVPACDRCIEEVALSRTTADAATRGATEMTAMTDAALLAIASVVHAWRQQDDNLTNPCMAEIEATLVRHYGDDWSAVLGGEQ